MTAYAFVGPAVTLTITATQRLTASGVAPLGTSSGTAGLVQVGFCTQVGAANPVNFAGLGYAAVTIGTRLGVPASASVVPGAGTYKVGMCILNSSSTAIDNNDYVNAWVMITNS
jgi:hypothetical protein